jgi:hypothetical protein
VGFVADLIFATRIENTASRLGYQVVWIERTDQLGVAIEQQPGRQFAEHVVGPGALLIDRISAWQPVLIIVDLGNPEIPWKEWVALLKSAPATRRIPVVCYGSHTKAETLRAARAAGADAVFARSRFIEDIRKIIQKYARVQDTARLQMACKERLSSTAITGLELFNRGEFFEAHEALEEAWNADTTVGRELYRAILQVAVAYLQIERGNYNGAIKMFWRLRQWIDPLPEECRGVNVAQLRKDAESVYLIVLGLGKEHLHQFDSRLFQPVHYQL